MNPAETLMAVRLRQAIRPYWYRVLNGGRLARARLRGLAFDLFVREYRTDGLTFTVPRHLTNLAFRSRFFSNTHERDEREAIRRYLPADCSVLELGAGLGIVSCLISSRLEQGHRHVAVEANPDLIEAIRANRDRNGLRFSIEHGVITGGGSAAFRAAQSISHGSTRPGAGGVPVPKLSMAELERRHAIAFDALVCDIEGGEKDFLVENSPFIGRCRAVVIQFHPKLIGDDACNKCRQILRDGGLVLAETLGTNEAWVRPGALKA